MGQGSYHSAQCVPSSLSPADSRLPLHSRIGELFFRAAHPHAVGAQHIRAIREEGDAAEPFGFALRAKHSIGGIEAFEPGIRRWLDRRDNFNLMRVAAQWNDQIASIAGEIIADFAVYFDRKQLEMIAIQPDRICTRSLGIVSDRQFGGNPSYIQPEIEMHFDLRDQPRIGSVILAPDHRRLVRGRGGIRHLGVSLDIHAGRFRLLCASVQRLDANRMKQMLIFGLGYTAARLADVLTADGWTIDATGSSGNIAFDDEDAVRAALRDASHVLSSVPPDRQTGEDPVLARYGEALPDLWIGYLSSTGVYGDQQGAWVDESTPTVAGASEGRRNARAEADAKWMQLGARVFRLPGIYGAGPKRP